MNIEENSQNTPRQRYINDLLKDLSDPTHRRLVEAYQGDSPVTSMESKLTNIILEILKNED